MRRKSYLDRVIEASRDRVWKRPEPKVDGAPDPKVKREVERSYDARPLTPDDV